MDDAWWKSSRHRMSQETVTGRFPSLLPGRRRRGSGTAMGWGRGRERGWSKGKRTHTDASKRFFDIAGSHPNALLRAVVDYQPPHPTHLIRRPRNVLTDPPDALTAAVGLNDVNDTHD
ncbi:hypothetical protein EVAR_6563_1 [Eumeta japonica]|uniref:Uncharacterized protein n=1 Tax=Eumeta variegata TaxID=151549 RepID=A0A4C1ST37_EUMVA|nr:hypothetical protein EVAR_6563_1 [Eumeta japonica]